MHRLIQVLSLALILCAMPGRALAAGDGPSAIPALDSTYYIPASGQTMSAAALAYWTNHDGVDLLGMPLTSSEGSSEQVFQYGAVRLTGSGEIKPVGAGRELVSLKYGPVVRNGGRAHAPSSPTTAFAPLADEPSGSSVIFDGKTRHSVKGTFARAYQALGGRGALGRPISEAYSYGPNRVQWFERGALLQDAGGVHLSAIGPELIARSGRTTGSADTNHRWVYLDRYVSTSGDGTVADEPTVFAPVAIQIPAIGVDANVEDVPIVDGAMQTPQDVWSVGWYYDLPAPGQYTNVVMAAHKDWWGVGPVVFYNLGNLVAGNLIYLWAADGNGATYQVTSVQIVDAEINAADVISDKDADTLTLITCGGDFDGAHYLSRVIIQAVRI